MTDLHWNTLAPGARKAFASVSRALAGGDYYLAGGTALALMEGHRISVDLDIFCPAMPPVEALLAQLRGEIEEISVSSVAKGTLYLEVYGAQVSVIEYRYPLLVPSVPSDGLGMHLASRDDITTMKLSAIAGRGSRKDFVDLWVVLSRHRSLREYLELFEKKFEVRDIGHVVRALVHFDDADSEPPLRLLVDIDWDKVKNDFRNLVADLLENGR